MVVRLKAKLKSSADVNNGPNSTGGNTSEVETTGESTSSGNTTNEESVSYLLNASDYNDPDPSDNNYHNFMAYSVRKVVSEYTGPFFKAKRADGVEADFGAGVDIIDTVALQSWIDAGGGSAYITTWYDQSGNSEHAHQTTVASMPVLESDCSAGGNHHPCLYFNEDFMLFNDSSSTSAVRMNNSTGMAMFLALKHNSTGDQMILGDSATNYELLHYGDTIHAYGNFFTLPQITNSFNLISLAVSNSNTGYLYSDGAYISSSNSMWTVSNGQGDTSKFSMIGRFFDSTNRKVDYRITEFIFINTPISREDTGENKHGELSTNIRNFYGL